MLKILKELRKAKGLTQKQVAEQLGVDPSAVCLWERGIFKPRDNLIPAICRIYGCTVSDIMNEKRK